MRMPVHRILGALAPFAAVVTAFACGGSSGSGLLDPLAGPDGAADGASPTTGGDGSTTTSDGAAPVPPTPASCTPDAGLDWSEPDPAKPRIVAGTNGTFTDTCDGQGNLVKYLCTSRSICGFGPNPDCDQVETGKADPKTIDCAGLCVGGGCASGCPVSGDELTVTANDADGGVRFTNKRDQRHYACELMFQQGGYDCKKAPYAGAAHFIVGLGLRGTYCTGKDFGNIGTGAGADPTKQSCTFRCDIVP
jgi:hypothetical protein